MNSWEIEDSEFSEESIIQNGNRMFCGNGFMGYRGTVDEADKSDMPGLIVNGIYDRHGDKWREPVNFPNPLFIKLSYNGLGLTLKSSDVGSHTQKLNFRYGLFERKTQWDISGTKVIVESQRFLSMRHRNLMCLKYQITSSKDITLDIKYNIDTEVYDANGPHFEIEKTYLNNNYDNKSMLIKVTDERLIEKTGGIVQGMSGSPIVQNGKFVGAVTHVIVNNPKEGYAVFGDMLIKQMKTV